MADDPCCGMGLGVQTFILSSNNDIFQSSLSAYYDLLTADVNHFILLYLSMPALWIATWMLWQHHCQPETNQLWRLTSQSMPGLDEYYWLRIKPGHYILNNNAMNSMTVDESTSEFVCLNVPILHFCTTITYWPYMLITAFCFTHPCQVY